MEELKQAQVGGDALERNAPPHQMMIMAVELNIQPLLWICVS